MEKKRKKASPFPGDCLWMYFYASLRLMSMALKAAGGDGPVGFDGDLPGVQYRRQVIHFLRV
jgi:hypothetical protein